MDTLQETTNSNVPLPEATVTSKSNTLDDSNPTRTTLPEATLQKDPLQEATPPINIVSDPHCPTTNIYYSCLSPGGSELHYLHHEDIVSRKCSVKLVHLNEKEISQHMTPSTNVLSTESSSSECGTKSDPEWNSRTKPKRPFKSRPLRVPSKSRIAAQKIIEENNKRKRKRKNAVPMKIYKDFSSVPVTNKDKHKSLPEPPTKREKSATTIPKPVPVPVTNKDKHKSSPEPPTKHDKSATIPKHTDTTLDKPDSDSDSDKTIDYEPPVKSPKKVFTTRTCGIKRTKKSRMYKCPKCGIKKTSLHSLNEHYQRRHRKVKCNVCGQSFNTPSSRDKHMYTHKSRKWYPCEHCDKDFPFESMLNDHKGKHTVQKRFPCWWPKCKKGFSFKGDLTKHIHAHRKKDKPIRCKYCDYENPDIRNVKQHERTHTDEKPHKCKYCGKGFRFWVQKKRHIIKDCKKNPSNQ